MGTLKGMQSEEVFQNVIRYCDIHMPVAILASGEQCQYIFGPDVACLTYMSERGLSMRR